MNEITFITTFFNPAGYQSLIENYNVFSARIKNLLTIEVAFKDQPFYLKDSIKLRSNSVMWLKEKLINYGFSLAKTDYVAWLDADLIFPDGFEDLLLSKLKICDFVQLFKRVYYLPKGHTNYQGEEVLYLPGIVYQKSCYKHWLEKRKEKEIPFAAPGFAWACNKKFYLYDRDVVGSGDCLLVDALMDTRDLHGFNIKYNDKMKKSILQWSENLKNKKVDYLPIDIFHLWHGDLKNRSYMSRHKILKDFDPEKDIEDINNVFEWTNSKFSLEEYFQERKDND